MKPTLLQPCRCYLPQFGVFKIILKQIKGDVWDFVISEQSIFKANMNLVYFLIFVRALGTLPFAHCLAGGARMNVRSPSGRTVVLITSLYTEYEPQKEVDFATGVLITRKHVVTGGRVCQGDRDHLQIFIGTIEHWNDEGEVYLVNRMEIGNLCKYAITDVCVLLLDRSAHYSNTVMVAPISPDPADFDEALHYAIYGFGLISDFKNHSTSHEPILDSLVYLTKVAKKECLEIHGSVKSALAEPLMKDAYFCAGIPHPQNYYTDGRKNPVVRATFGDYGAPIFVKEIALVGISVYHVTPKGKGPNDHFPTPFLIFTPHVRTTIWKLVHKLGT